MSQPQQKFNIYEDYDLPSWSGKPQQKYFLEIIKNGATVSEKPISEKQFYLIGKFDKVSDIVLEHPSISRKHAIIQFKNNGEIFLYDLGSTHGTKVNRKVLPSKVYHKLNIFDTIQFGLSSRMYILRCIELEEKEDQQEQEKLEKSEKNNENEENQDKKDEKTLKEKYLDLLETDPYYKQQQKAKRNFQGGSGQGDEGVSWGQVDEQEIYQFQDNEIALDPALLKRLPELTDKQTDKIEKYEIKLRKYRNHEEQLQEMIQKEKKQFGLEQRHQEIKHKLQEKVIDLGSQVEQAEQAIRVSFFGEDPTAMHQEKTYKNYKKEQQEDTFGDDDFYDRSLNQNTTNQIDLYQSKMQKKIQAQETTTENYWDLKKRLESLVKVRHHYNLKILEMKDDEKTKNNEEEEEEDELEKFMRETGHQVKEENRQMTIQKLKEVNDEITQVTEMLSKIKPDLKVQDTKADKIEDIFGENEEDQEKEKQKQQKEQKKIEEKQEEKEKKGSDFQMPLTKISKTLGQLKKVKKNHEFEDFDDNDEEMDDEQILQMASKQLEREKAYMKKLNMGDEEEFEDKKLEYIQSQYFKDNNENIKKNQSVFDLAQQGLQKSKRKQKEEEKQKLEEEKRKQYYDNIITPFENE